jgi:hypothetical protein
MYNGYMMKYIIGGCALGIVLGSLPIGIGAAFALYFWTGKK